LLAVLLFALAVAVAGKVRYDGYQVYRLNVLTDDHIQMVRDMHENIELDFWSDTDVMIPPHLKAAITTTLDAADLPYEIIIENVQDDLDVEEKVIADREGKAYDLYNWNTYEQIVEAVDDFVSSCPPDVSCSKASIGSSYLGNDIPALEITSGDKKYIYLDSLIHCREWLAGSTVLLIADRLINGDDATAQRMRTTYNWYIAPVINPDGYLFTWSDNRMWRKNRQPNSGSSCVGTDLNRNFDIRWGFSGTSTNPCADTYGGSRGGSGTETNLVQNKLNSLGSNLHGVISYHSYARMWLHAYGYTTTAGGSTCAVSSNHADINRVALAARNAVQSTGGQSWTYGPVCSVIYPASGSTVDYSHDVSGAIYAYTPELRGTSFAPPTSEIVPSYEEQWAGLVAMADAI
jgi:carboxypeptidase A2